METKNKSLKGKRYSLCMSIDTSFNINYMLKEGSINGDDFNTFIKETNDKYKNKDKKKIQNVL